MGQKRLGFLTEDEIEIQRQLVMQDRQMSEFGVLKIRQSERFKLSTTGCAGLGERWTGSGWAYCVRRSHCRAEETLRLRDRPRP